MLKSCRYSFIGEAKSYLASEPQITRHTTDKRDTGSLVN